MARPSLNGSVVVNASTTGRASVTQSFTIPADADSLIVGVLFLSGSGTPSIDDVTWDGTTLPTVKQHSHSWSTRDILAEFWHMGAGDTGWKTGTFDVVVTYDSARVADAVGIAAINDGETLSAVIGTGNGNGSAHEVTNTFTDSNGLLWYMAARLDGSTSPDFTPQTGTSKHVDDRTGITTTFDFIFTIGEEDSAAGLVTVGSNSGSANEWVAIACEFEEAAASSDPEGPLVGGKLIDGGLLVKGRLVGA